jgi:hypothetical protein
MNPAVLAAAALAALAAPAGRIAHAGCGGGGGPGGGSGGSTWYLRATGDCQDTSDVVGLRRCTRFAAWGKSLEYPHLLIEGGALVRRFPSLLDHQTGSVIHGAESFTYRVVQPSGVRRLDTAVLSSLRGSVGLSRAVYGGIEVDLGSVTRPGPAATEMTSTGVFGSPDLQQGHGVLVDSLGVVGLHAAVGFVGVELAGGLRAVSYSFHSNYHDCRQLTSVTALAAVGEARARGELWLSPWLTAGVTLGTSVLERGAWMGGVYLGVHSRAFGGDR